MKFSNTKEVLDAGTQRALDTGLSKKSPSLSSLTPDDLYKLALDLEAANLGVTTKAMVDNKVWQVIVRMKGFVSELDPSATLYTGDGRLGKLLGIEIFSDAFLHPLYQFLPKNQITLFSTDASREIVGAATLSFKD